MILLSLAATPAFAQSADAIAGGLDLTQLQSAADNMNVGINIKKTILDVISGQAALNGDMMYDIASGYLPDVLSGMRNTLAAFLLPLLAYSLMTRLLPRVAAAAGLTAACACTGIFAVNVAHALRSARSLIAGMGDMLEAALPVLTSLSAMGGGTSSAALLTPMTTLLGDIMVNILDRWGLGLTVCVAACAFAAAIGPELKLTSLSSLLKRMVQVGCGLMLALFAGLLKVQGMLGRSFDSAAVKTARFAIDKIVPSVGGGIADTMDAAISSILLVKSAVGVTGMAALALAAFAPIVELTSALIGIRLACAICQPVGDSPLIAAAGEFGDVLRLLIVICSTALTLCLVLTGAAIGAGRSVAG